MAFVSIELTHMKCGLDVFVGHWLTLAYFVVIAFSQKLLAEFQCNPAQTFLKGCGCSSAERELILHKYYLLFLIKTLRNATFCTKTIITSQPVFRKWPGLKCS